MAILSFIFSCERAFRLLAPQEEFRNKVRNNDTSAAVVIVEMAKQFNRRVRAMTQWNSHDQMQQQKKWLKRKLLR